MVAAGHRPVGTNAHRHAIIANVLGLPRRAHGYIAHGYSSRYTVTGPSITPVCPPSASSVGRTRAILRGIFLRHAWLLLLTLAIAHPARARAQDVYGHLPESSPYRDVSSGHELSIIGGYIIAGHDPAGAAPRSAPLVGVRELIHLGGPVISFLRVQHSFSDRRVINPALSAGDRVTGTTKDGLTIGDIDLGINLTGDRSWNNLVPFISLGAGVVSDLGAPRDVGKYHFGTAFAGTFGGGFRWVTSGPLSITFSANNYLWRHHDPPTYHVPGADGTTVIPTTRPLSGYRNNGVYTLGVSYAIFR
jgi:hypothetical protein